MGAALPRRLHGTLHILKALTMTYIVTPYKRPPREAAPGLYDIVFIGEVCRHSEADEFVVSFVSDDGSVKRIATFINYDDALLFVNAKEP